MAARVLPRKRKLPAHLEGRFGKWHTYTDPDLVRYRDEVTAYEGFYLTSDECVKNFLCSKRICDPTDERHIHAAKLAIEEYNIDASEPIQLEEVIRVNYQMIKGTLRYITLRASDGKFYETKVSIYRRELVTFHFFRPAKYHPVLPPIEPVEPTQT